MRPLFTTLFLAAAPACLWAQEAARPNVILLVADDLGYGDLSCYGAQAVATPTVDSLARDGLRFTRCHAAAATSTPSRYSLLTGEYCSRRPNTDIAAGNAQLLIAPEQYTLADVFRSRGYATAAIGKWHLGLGRTTAQQDWNGQLDLTPADIGFDYHYLMAATADRVPCVYIEQGRVANYDASAPISVSYTQNFAGEPTGADNPELLTKLRHSHGHNNSIVNGIGRIGWMKGGGTALWRDEDIADSIAAHALSFIDRHAREPFFMYLCTNDVHVPRYPHERFRGRSPLGLRGEAILQFDYTVRLLTDHLRRLGLADNTLLIITSDNGPVLDDGYQDQAIPLSQAAGHQPGGPWRGGKYSAFEAGTAVPLIVHWPGHVAAGESDALVSHIDALASLARLVGDTLPAGAAIDSRDALSTWLGHDHADRPFCLTMAQDRTLALLTPRWKYIEPSNGAAVNGNTHIELGYNPQPQLYDLLADPGETQNRAVEQPLVADTLRRIMQEVRGPYASSDSVSYWYQLYTPQRDTRAMNAASTGAGLTGVKDGRTKTSQWRFLRRADGTFDIQNRSCHGFLVPTEVKRPALQLKTSALRPATGWTLTADGIHNGRFIITNGTSQVNQAGGDNNWRVLNWGDGTTLGDPGCNYWLNILDVERTRKPSAIAPVAASPTAARAYTLSGIALGESQKATARGLIIVDGRVVRK